MVALLDAGALDAGAFVAGVLAPFAEGFFGSGTGALLAAAGALFETGVLVEVDGELVAVAGAWASAWARARSVFHRSSAGRPRDVFLV